METLNYKVLEGTGYNGYILKDAPVKVMQFGEGNFLRAFVDYFYDIANEKAGYNGKVKLVQPIGNFPQMADWINEQEGLYTLYLRGSEKGQKVDAKRVISCVSDCVCPYIDGKWDEVLELARSADLETIVSNTTEAGIAYTQGDSQFDQVPPNSFPAKLTRVLFERYKAFNGAADKGLAILSCELIDHNGEELEKCCEQYADLWNLGDEFKAWLKKENDFWDVATGRKAVKGVRLAVPEDELFIYGEVLQDRNVPEKEYADYFGQTASGYGHKLRAALDKGSVEGLDILSWDHEAAPEYLTTWVESHDTYANAHESAHLTDDQIRVAWVFLTARQNGTPLFFSRPAGSTRTNYYGNNVLGARGNDEFFNPEVAAVNRFRSRMSGQTEKVEVSPNGQVLLVSRGKKGAALVNINKSANSADLPTTLPDGTYRDVVYGKEFKVRKGRLQGILAPMRSYILEK